MLKKCTEKWFTSEFSDIYELKLAAERYENAEQLQAYNQRLSMREENISRVSPNFTRRAGN